MWTFFKDSHPEIGRKVTIIWNDWGEMDCIWSGNVDWNLEMIPVLWKYID